MSAAPGPEGPEPPPPSSTPPVWAFRGQHSDRSLNAGGHDDAGDQLLPSVSGLSNTNATTDEREPSSAASVSSTSSWQAVVAARAASLREGRPSPTSSTSPRSASSVASNANISTTSKSSTTNIHRTSRTGSGSLNSKYSQSSSNSNLNLKPQTSGIPRPPMPSSSSTPAKQISTANDMSPPTVPSPPPSPEFSSASSESSSCADVDRIKAQEDTMPLPVIFTPPAPPATSRKPRSLSSRSERSYESGSEPGAGRRRVPLPQGPPPPQDPPPAAAGLKFIPPPPPPPPTSASLAKTAVRHKPHIPLPQGPPPPLADANKSGSSAGSRHQQQHQDQDEDYETSASSSAGDDFAERADHRGVSLRERLEAIRRQTIEAWMDDSDHSMREDPILEETDADIEYENEHVERRSLVGTSRRSSINSTKSAASKENDVKVSSSPRGSFSTGARPADLDENNPERKHQEQDKEPSHLEDREGHNIENFQREEAGRATHLPPLKVVATQSSSAVTTAPAGGASRRLSQKASEGSEPSSTASQSYLGQESVDSDLIHFMRAPDYPPPPSSEDGSTTAKVFFPYEYPESMQENPIERQSDHSLQQWVHQSASGPFKTSLPPPPSHLPSSRTTFSKPIQHSDLISQPNLSAEHRSQESHSFHVQGEQHSEVYFADGSPGVNKQGDDSLNRENQRDVVQHQKLHQQANENTTHVRRQSTLDNDSYDDDESSFGGFIVPPPQALTEHQALDAILAILKESLEDFESRGYKVVPRRRVHEVVMWFDERGDGEIAKNDLAPLLVESLGLPIEDEAQISKLARAMNRGVPADYKVPYMLLMQAADEFALQMHKRRSTFRSKSTPFPLAILSSAVRASSSPCPPNGAEMPAPTPRSAEAYRRLARYALWINELRIWPEHVDVEVLQMNFQNGTLFCKLVDVLMTQWNSRGQVSSGPSDLFRGVHWNIRGLTRSPCLKNIETGLSVVWKQRGITARNMPTAVQVYSGDPRAICSLLREIIASVVFGGSISTSSRVQTVLNWFDRILTTAGRSLPRTVVRPPHHSLWLTFQKGDALLTVLHQYFPDAVRLDAVFDEPKDSDEIRSNAEELLGHLKMLAVPSGLVVDDFEEPHADSLEFLVLLLFAIRSRLRAERAVRGGGTGGLVFRNRTFSEASTAEHGSMLEASEADEHRPESATQHLPWRSYSNQESALGETYSSFYSPHSNVSSQPSPPPPPLPGHSPPPPPPFSSPLGSPGFGVSPQMKSHAGWDNSDESPSSDDQSGSVERPVQPIADNRRYQGENENFSANADMGWDKEMQPQEDDVADAYEKNNRDPRPRSSPREKLSDRQQIDFQSSSTGDSALFEQEIALHERRLMREHEERFRARIAQRKKQIQEHGQQQVAASRSTSTSQEKLRAGEFDHQEKLEVARSFFHRRQVIIYKRDLCARCELSLSGSQLEWKSLPSEPRTVGYLLLGDIDSVNLNNAADLRVEVTLQRAHHKTRLHLQGLTEKDTLTLFANLNALLLPHLHHPRYS